MAIPLRRTADGYTPYAAPGQRRTERTGPARNTDVTPKRLVRRQVKSNALYRRTIAWLFMGMFTVMFLMGFSYTYVKAGVSRLNYDIHAVQSENEQIVLDNAKIQGQIAELRSLERIEELAGRELGMVKNHTVDYMLLSGTLSAEGMIRLEEDSVGEQFREGRRENALIRFFREQFFK